MFLQDKYSLDNDIAAHLLESYGTNSIDVADLGAKMNLNSRIHKDFPVLKAQVIYAIRCELATNMRDVIFRRLGIGFVNQKAVKEFIPIVADIMANELKWSEEKKNQEIEFTQKNVMSLG